MHTCMRINGASFLCLFRDIWILLNISSKYICTSFDGINKYYSNILKRNSYIVIYVIVCFRTFLIRLNLNRNHQLVIDVVGDNRTTNSSELAYY